MKKILIFMMLLAFAFVKSGICLDECEVLRSGLDLEKVRYLGKEWAFLVRASGCDLYIVFKDVVRRGDQIKVPFLCFLVEEEKSRFGIPSNIHALYTVMALDCRGRFRFEQMIVYDDKGRYVDISKYLEDSDDFLPVKVFELFCRCFGQVL